jgi:hypothetical protein
MRLEPVAHVTQALDLTLVTQLLNVLQQNC